MGTIIKNQVIYGGICGGGDNSVDLTMAEYEALEVAGEVKPDTTYYITDVNDEYTAKTIAFDNTDTDLEATNIQDAIVEQNEKVGELNKNFTNFGIVKGNSSEQTINYGNNFVRITNWKTVGMHGFKFEDGQWVCPKDGIARIDAIIELTVSQAGSNAKLAFVNNRSNISYRFGGRPQGVYNEAWSASALISVKAGDKIDIKGVQWSTDQTLTINGAETSVFCISYI